MSATISYSASIIKFLGRIGVTNGTVNPDTSNTGKYIGDAFLWDCIAKYAKGKSEIAWKALTDRGLIEDKAGLLPGNYILVENQTFAVTAKVSEKVHRFDPDELCNLLFKSHKIPKHTMLELIEKAKVPKNSIVTMTIVEK